MTMEEGTRVAGEIEISHTKDIYIIRAITHWLRWQVSDNGKVHVARVERGREIGRPGHQDATGGAAPSCHGDKGEGSGGGRRGGEHGGKGGPAIGGERYLHRVGRGAQVGLVGDGEGGASGQGDSRAGRCHSDVGDGSTEAATEDRLDKVVRVLVVSQNDRIVVGWVLVPAVHVGQSAVGEGAGIDGAQRASPEQAGSGRHVLRGGSRDIDARPVERQHHESGGARRMRCSGNQGGSAVEGFDNDGGAGIHKQKAHSSETASDTALEL